jgi:rhodanese-related sulfurtransferase
MAPTQGDVAESRRGFLLLPVFIGGLYLLGQSAPSKQPAYNVKEILLEEAKLLMAAGALVIDVRQRAAYEARHIAGAMLAPLSTLSSAIPASLEYARSLPVIVYCGDGSTLGPEGTHHLNKAGFAGAVNLKPGMQGWASAGLPIEHGPGKQA